MKDLGSYPQWTQDVVHSCAEAKRRVVNHELYRMMRDAELGPEAARKFFVGVWPVIEQFPQYMAMNLLKLRYGRSRGEDMARRYLIRNLRVEQNHADYWVDWAVASGVTVEALISGTAPMETQVLSHWCWQTCDRDTLAAAMAATNYAIEGATGEWACLVCSSDTYAGSFEPGLRKKAMKWFKVHADYDDTHPWEALEIICTLLGTRPDAAGVARVRACIHTSYEYMRLTLDHCLLAEGNGSRTHPRPSHGLNRF